MTTRLATSRRTGFGGTLRRIWPALLAGVGGTAGLTIVYLGIVSLAESWSHALQLFREDAPYAVPILLGFGVQTGLFAYLKKGLHLPEGARGAGALTGAAGGTSTVAMVACCAHHVTDVLPLVGLSAAAVFLAEYRIWFMLVGLLTNLVGIVVMVRILFRERRRVLQGTWETTMEEACPR